MRGREVGREEWGIRWGGREGGGREVGGSLTIVGIAGTGDMKRSLAVWFVIGPETTVDSTVLGDQFTVAMSQILSPVPIKA